MTKFHICSFCGKTEIKARAIVAGPGVNICAECIEICLVALLENGFLNHKWRDKYRYMWE